MGGSFRNPHDKLPSGKATQARNGWLMAEIAPRTTTRAAAATTATATTHSAPAVFPWTGFVDGEGATIEFFTVEIGNGRVCPFFSGHGDESKSTRATGGPIEHEIHFADRSVRGKSVLQVVLGRLVGKVSYVQFCVHYDVIRAAGFLRKFPTIGFQTIIEAQSTDDPPGPEITNDLLMPPRCHRFATKQAIISFAPRRESFRHNIIRELRR